MAERDDLLSRSLKNRSIRELEQDHPGVKVHHPIRRQIVSQLEPSDGVRGGRSIVPVDLQASRDRNNLAHLPLDFLDVRPEQPRVCNESRRK